MAKKTSKEIATELGIDGRKIAAMARADMISVTTNAQGEKLYDLAEVKTGLKSPPAERKPMKKSTDAARPRLGKRKEASADSSDDQPEGYAETLLQAQQASKTAFRKVIFERKEAAQEAGDIKLELALLQLYVESENVEAET